MSKKLMYILVGIIALLLVIICILSGISIYVVSQLQNQLPANTTTQTNNGDGKLVPPVEPKPTPEPAPAINPTPESTTKIFENSYMKFTYPSDWSISKTSEYQINVTKGNYILYFNTQASQASGVKGGRFNEISSGAPSADAVMKVLPSDPCGTNETANVEGFDSQYRTDLYISGSANTEMCSVPSNGKTVWYFSYINTLAGGYFNYYVENEAKAYVITMSYKSSTVNNFPVKGSAELEQNLSEMTGIVESLDIKIK